MRTFVDSPTTQVPTDHLATMAQPYEYSQMLKACLAVPRCISFTVWGFGDANSWIPGFFQGEGYACIYDVNLNPKPAYTDLQQDLTLAATARHTGCTRKIARSTRRPVGAGGTSWPDLPRGTAGGVDSLPRRAFAAGEERSLAIKCRIPPGILSEH